MDHAVGMRVLQRACDLGCDADRGRYRELLLPLETIAERLAIDERHHVEDGACYLSRVMQRQNVRMLEIRGRPDLRQKASGTDDGGELRLQNFERDLAVVTHVVREVDRGHSAGTQL